MTRFTTNSLAAFAAIILTISSIGTVITVPEASAQVVEGHAQITELA